MRSRHFAFAVALLLAAAAALPAAARPRDRFDRHWELLGEKAVTDRAETDTLVVTGARGTFRALKLKVLDHGVQFREVTIHFASGATQEVALRSVIPAGGESRAIDVQGRGDRVIRSIVFRYDAQSLGGGNARVQVFGKN
jgi:hypothetical protein